MTPTPSYTAVIVDDETKPAEALRIKLEPYHPDILVSAVCHSAPDALEKILMEQPDILFLDIEMPLKSGLDLLEVLNKANRQLQVIITSAYTNIAYLQNAIRLDAIDYLVKPIMKEELDAAIQRALKKLSPKQSFVADKSVVERQMSFNCATGKLLLHANQIVYVKAEGNYCRFHLADGSTEMVTEMMKTLEDCFQHTALIRVDRSHLINTRHVRKVTANACLCYFHADCNTKPVELSQRGVKALMQSVQ